MLAGRRRCRCSGLSATTLARGNFGADWLAGISIVTAVLLGEYLVGAIVVLMLSGGTALEQYATRRASHVLEALAKRLPHIAHRVEAGQIREVAIADIRVGDELRLLPHEICPVDGDVVAGQTTMDESYLTGEPFLMQKTPGAPVISGAVNGDGAITIRATRLPEDSRYARIMRVMREAEEHRPAIRRIADRLGGWYTPAAVAVGVAGWAGRAASPIAFLAVMVIATPCPLLIAIPVAIIGAISLAARRGIIIKNPGALEEVEQCRTLILDKTGTLTYGRPTLTDIVPAPPWRRAALLRAGRRVSSSIRSIRSRWPWCAARANGASSPCVTSAKCSERPGLGLRGRVDGRDVFVTGRQSAGGARGGRRAAAHRRRPRGARVRRRRPTPARCGFATSRGATAGRSFSTWARGTWSRARCCSPGDRDSEVRYLADHVGIANVHAGASPEDKVEIVRRETALAKTMFVGDGINDAPAMQAATVGVAFGNQNEITAEAADAVILEPSLVKLDEFLHIARRMRRVALQSAIGGMALSIAGMVAAAMGYLPPIYGAVAQEVIDLAAVLNALRVAMPSRRHRRRPGVARMIHGAMRKFVPDLRGGVRPGRSGRARRRRQTPPFFFLQFSDPQFGMFTADKDFAQETANFEMAIATANRLQPAFVVVTGDLVNKAGDAAQIAEYRRIARRLDPAIPLYNVAGQSRRGERADAGVRRRLRPQRSAATTTRSIRQRCRASCSTRA